MNKIQSYLEKFGLNPKKIIDLYMIILTVGPIAYVLLFALRRGNEASMLKVLTTGDPQIIILTIALICDALLGYALWLEKRKLLNSNKQYLSFIKLQILGQAMMGNWVCFLLALMGLLTKKQVSRYEDYKGALLPLTYTVTGIFTMCFFLKIYLYL